MAYRKLNLDRDKISQCRDLAARIVKPVQKYIDRHSTVSIESSCLCSFGIDRIVNGRPVADAIIDRIDRDRLRRGIAFWFGSALVHTGLSAQDVAAKIANGELSFDNVPDIPLSKIRGALSPLISFAVQKMNRVREERKLSASRFETSAPSPSSLLMAAPENNASLEASLGPENGADIIFFHTLKERGQSAQTHRTKCVGPKQFATSVLGLNASQEAFTAATNGVNIIAHDAFGEILKRGVNPKRALVDAHCIRRICAKTDITLFCENAHTADVDGYRETHQAIASQFIAEQFAIRAKINPEKMAIGHAYDMDPFREGGFLLELARAAMVRDFYPRSPLVYMPPPIFSTGSDIEKKIIGTLFLCSSVMTEQSVIYLPFNIDFAGLLKGARTIIQATRTLGDEIQFVSNGKIDRRANTILENALRFLGKIEGRGLLDAFSHGVFAGIHAEEKGGIGLDGVFQKDRNYFNPLEDILDGKIAGEEISKAHEKTGGIAEKEAKEARQPSAPKEGKRRSYRRRGGRYRGHHAFKSTHSGKTLEKAKRTDYPPKNG